MWFGKNPLDLDKTKEGQIIWMKNHSFQSDDSHLFYISGILES